MGIQDLRNERMILGFLMSGPKTGYRLRTIARRMALFYNVTLNKIYPVLRRLEREGFVSKEVILQQGRPNQHLYSLTAEGRKHFLKLLTCTPVPFDYSFDFLTRVFFFRFLTPDRALEQFAAEIESLESQLQELKGMRERVETQADPNGRFAYETAVQVVSFLIEWYRKEWEKRRRERTTTDEAEQVRKPEV